MTDEFLDATPDPHFLRSLRAERFDPILLACEAIDNSFDADARNIVVDIDIAKDTISFEDDGSGVLAKNLPALVILGRHGEMPTTKIGFFGVGFKQQAFNAGEIAIIDSTSHEGRFNLRIDWTEIMRRGWARAIRKPTYFTTLPSSRTGTRIVIEELRRSKSFDPTKLQSELALHFDPALAAGQRIIVNKQSIIQLREPRMSDIVECELPLEDGRGAHVRAGILIDEQSQLYRVHVSYKHRVIMPRCSIGCEKYSSGISKIFARVALSGAWELSRFKNDLVNDDQREQLQAALADVLHPLLEKCRAQAMSANLEEIEAELNAKLPPELMPARPRHKKEKGRGPSGDRTQKKNLVEDADIISDGPARKRNPRPTLKIDFEGRPEDGIGVFERGKPCRVHLVKDHPTIARLLDCRDAAVRTEALFTHAFWLFLNGLQADEKQLDLFDMPAGLQISKLLGMQDFVQQEQQDA